MQTVFNEKQPSNKTDINYSRLYPNKVVTMYENS